MPVTAQTRGGELNLRGRGSLLAAAQMAGLPVASACSGRGACGKCVMTILHGGDGLPPASAHELAVLARNGCAPGQRLSCQVRLGRAELNLRVRTEYW